LTANRRQIGVPERHTPYDTNLPGWRPSVSLSPEGCRWWLGQPSNLSRPDFDFSHQW
jgi:hypothetical protein